MKALLSLANYCILIFVIILLTCDSWCSAAAVADGETVREEIIDYDDSPPQKESVETVNKKSKKSNIGVGNENTGESEVNIGHGHTSEKGWSILNTNVLNKPKVIVDRAGFVSGKGANQQDRDIDISTDGDKKSIKI